MSETSLRKYCPVCGKWLAPVNELEVNLGEESGYVYVHDEIHHSEDDLKAMWVGVQ